MKQITFDRDSNLGGVQQLYAIGKDNINSLEKNRATGTINIDLLDSDSVIDIYCTPGSLVFSEESSISASGTSYKVTVQGSIPKANALNAQLMERMERNYWLLLLTDNNGQIRLIGDKDTQLSFTKTETTGKAVNSKNAVSFNFGATMDHPAYFVDEISY